MFKMSFLLVALLSTLILPMTAMAGNGSASENGTGSIEQQYASKIRSQDQQNRQLAVRAVQARAELISNSVTVQQMQPREVHMTVGQVVNNDRWWKLYFKMRSGAVCTGYISESNEGFYETWLPDIDCE